MKCNNCYNEIPDESDFCPFCLTKLVEEEEGEPIKEKKINPYMIIIICATALLVIATAITVAIKLTHKTNLADTAITQSDSANSDNSRADTASISEPASVPAEDKGIVEPTDIDWEELNDILSHYYETSSFDYKDSNKTQAFSFVYNGYGHLNFYYKLFGQAQWFNRYDENYVRDPKGIFELGYSKCPIENVNWIVKNIMNVEPGNFKELLASEHICEIEEKNKCVAMYVQDGYYYVGAYYLNGNDGYFNKLNDVKRKQLAGGKYDISAFIDDSRVEDGFDAHIDATVAVKEVDGKRFWSIYKYERTDYNS